MATALAMTTKKGFRPAPKSFVVAITASLPKKATSVQRIASSHLIHSYPGQPTAKRVCPLRGIYSGTVSGRYWPTAAGRPRDSVTARAAGGNPLSYGPSLARPEIHTKIPSVTSVPEPLNPNGFRDSKSLEWVLATRRRRTGVQIIRNSLVAVDTIQDGHLPFTMRSMMPKQLPNVCPGRRSSGGTRVISRNSFRLRG